MTYDELLDFLKNRMRLSHVYQPLLVLCLVRAGGRATLRQLAVSFLVGDDSIVDYYVERIRQMPVPVLAGHGVVQREGDVVSLTTGPLTREQTRRIEGVCRERLESFLRRRGLDLEAVPEILRQQALGAVNRSGSSHPTLDSTGPGTFGPYPSPDRTEAEAFGPGRAVAGCPLCSPEVKALAVAKNRLAYAVRHPRARDPGHVIVVPHRHTPDFFEMTAGERRDAEDLLLYLRDRIRNASSRVVAFDVITSSNPKTAHAHIHLIPRTADGGTVTLDDLATLPDAGW
jgi:diadenosine tetraphosphate (Ap4A) HIT family hydrolase